MARATKRVCWDACAWIALILDEKIPPKGPAVEHRGAMCRAIVEQARKGKLEIVTSAFSLAEVCKKREVKDDDPSKIEDFFENDFILTVSLDRTIGELARKLMMSGQFGLKPADACHLATALIAPRVVALHTFDRALLDLDGQIDRVDGSGKLKICKPEPITGDEPPLLEAIKDAQKED